MSLAEDKVDLECNEKFIEKVSDKVYEHRRKRFRSSTSSVEDEDSQLMREIVKQEMESALQKIDKSIQLLLSNSSETNKTLGKLVNTVDSQGKAIVNIRTDMDVLRTDQAKINEDLKKESKSNSKEIKTVRGQLVNLQKEVDKIKSDKASLQKKVIDSEYRSRRNNLLFFGICEEERAVEDVEQKVIDFVKTKLEIDCDKKFLGLQRAHRLGAPRRGMIGKQANRPRPIIVCFSDFKVKELVRDKRHLLKAPFGMANDLPLAVRKAQKSLMPQLSEIKKKEERAAIVYPARIVAPGNSRPLAEADVADFFE